MSGETGTITSRMNFGQAIEAAKEGKKIQRQGWNGKDMWVVLMPELKLPPYFAMWTADKKWLPGWLASQTDMLADDWQII